jgi:Domain of unknown function (DUF4410)
MRLIVWLPAFAAGSDRPGPVSRVHERLRQDLRRRRDVRHRRSRFAQAIAFVAVTVLMVGCGAHRMAPVDPRAVGALKPEIEDPDAGLVGIAPGFNVKAYRVIVVASFPVAPNEIKDEDDTRLAKDMSAYLRAQLVSKLRTDGTFSEVIDGGIIAEPPVGDGVLLLQGDISRLTEGSQALRYWVGFGAGATKAQIETRFLDGQSREVRMITADRRAAGMGIFGGDSRQFITESMDQMADGLVRFLRRLGAGGQPAQR